MYLCFLKFKLITWDRLSVKEVQKFYFQICITLESLTSRESIFLLMFMHVHWYLSWRTFTLSSSARILPVSIEFLHGDT